jgi:acetyltransferase-like isoleucine patch superfamily enzyme
MIKRKLEEIGSIIYRHIFYPFVRMAIEIRTNSIMKQGSYLNKGSVLAGKNYIGKNVQLSNVKVGYGSVVNNYSDLTNAIVGKYCSVGVRVVTSEGSHPVDGKHVALHTAFYNTKRVHGFSYTKKDTFSDMKYIDREAGVQVIIGNDVWIGNNVNIFDGVTIGDGAAIASGAVVTKDVEPYAIYGGLPAKLIRFRFPQETIDRLLKDPWWDKPEAEIEKRAAAGDFDDVDVFLKDEK